MMVETIRGIILRYGIRHAAGERIGEMGMIVRVIDPIHQRDERLSRQHGGKHHAEDGDHASQRKMERPTQSASHRNGHTRN